MSTHTHTKKYGLLTTLILHTILILKKKTQLIQCSPNPNVCNQRHLKTSAEITSKNKNKKKKKKKERKEKEQRNKKTTRKLLIIPSQHTGRSTLKHT